MTRPVKQPFRVSTQYQCGNSHPVLKIGGCLSVTLHYDMQNNPVVNWVVVVPVSLPVAGFHMNFYMSFYQSAADSNNSIPEISAAVVISPSRVDYLDWFTVLGEQRCIIQQLMLPEFNNLSFGDSHLLTTR